MGRHHGWLRGESVIVLQENAMCSHRHPGAGREPFSYLLKLFDEHRHFKHPMDPGLRREDVDLELQLNATIETQTYQSY